MKRIKFVFVVLLSLIVVSCDILDTGRSKKKDYSLQTLDPSNITSTSAVLYASVNVDNLPDKYQLGFFISTNVGPSQYNGTKVLVSDIGNNNTFSALAIDLEGSKTYYYCAFVLVGSSYVFSEEKQLITKPFKFGAVDLGLSVKWANANIGVDTPEGAGDYYAWGEIEPKDGSYSWSTYKYCNGGRNNLTKYNTKANFGYVDNKTVLDDEDDVAHVKLGGSWRMPTWEEMLELMATKGNPAYNWTWKTINDVSGWNISFLGNGNSIFFPSVGNIYNDNHNTSHGHYWSSLLSKEDPDCAWSIEWDKTGVNTGGLADRFIGQSVRAVSEE